MTRPAYLTSVLIMIKWIFGLAQPFPDPWDTASHCSLPCSECSHFEHCHCQDLAFSAELSRGLQSPRALSRGPWFLGGPGGCAARHSSCPVEHSGVSAAQRPALLLESLLDLTARVKSGRLHFPQVTIEASP